VVVIMVVISGIVVTTVLVTWKVNVADTVRVVV